MREFRCLEEQAFVLEVFQDHRVSLLDEYTGPVCLLGEFALAVDKIDKRDVVLLADAVIVFTESRG